MGSDKPNYDWPIPDLRYRLAENVGRDFLFGAPVVSTFHFVKGLRGAPNGGRLAAGAQAVRANSPRVVGSFAAFGALFCAAECFVSFARGGKDDALSTIAAGAAANSLRSSSQGAFVAARAGLIGGSVVAAFLGVLHTLSAQVDRRHCSRIPTDPVSPAPVAVAPQLQAASRSSGH